MLLGMKYKLKDLCKIKHGYAFKGKDILKIPTKYILVTPGNFAIGGGFKEDKCKYFNEQGEFPKEYILKANDLIVTMTDLSVNSDTLGYGALVPKNKIYLHNQRIGLVYDIKGDIILKEYLYWYMRTYKYQKAVVASQSGTAIHHTSPERILEIVVDIPNIKEQQKVVNILFSIEKKIELNNQIKDNLYEQAETFFKKEFVNHQCDNLIWSTYKLEEIFYHISPGTNYQPKRMESGIPFLNVKNINNGYIDYKDAKFIAEEDYKKVHKTWIPEVNDLLISRIGTLGLVAVIRNEDLPIAVHYKFLDLKTKTIPFQFAYFLLKSNYFQKKYRNNVKQSVQEYVTVDDIRNIEIELPKDNTIFHKYIIIYDKILNIQRQNKTLALLRETLLPKLMNGEIDLDKTKN